ncbi:MAG TPA: thioesterase family protein [Candidatus Glassbacteria bacterium]|nr:thioesterase family protein [Candidatus Glassbacteria bacterium]
MVTESEIVTRYAETDRMGVVYHANYLVWMEVGRTDYLAALGFPYSRLEETGVMFPACDASIRLHKPSYYEDRLKVETRLELLQSRKVAFAYRVLRGTELVVSGRTEHVCVDAKMRVRKIPAPLFEALGRSFDGAH